MRRGRREDSASTTPRAKRRPVSSASKGAALTVFLKPRLNSPRRAASATAWWVAVTQSCNRMAAVDRVAVLAALNLAHELQQLRDENSVRDRELTRSLDILQRKLDSLPEL